LLSLLLPLTYTLYTFTAGEGLILPGALGFLCQFPPNYYHVHAAHHAVQTHEAVQDLGRSLVRDHELVLLWRADLKGYGRLVGRERASERERVCVCV
jgi:hypothetical protein